MGRLVPEVAHHLGLEVVYGSDLSANALLAVVHFLAPSTQHVEPFGDCGCSLLQSVFDFASEVSQSSISGLC
jgi:hypothetical protein